MILDFRKEIKCSQVSRVAVNREYLMVVTINMMIRKSSDIVEKRNDYMGYQYFLVFAMKEYFLNERSTNKYSLGHVCIRMNICRASFTD